MKSFILDLQSLHWWLSAVIVGLIVNIVSSYIKEHCDRFLMKISVWWRKKTDRPVVQREKFIKRLKSSAEERARLNSEIIEERIRAISNAIGALMCYIIGLSDFSQLGITLKASDVIPVRVSLFAAASLSIFTGVLCLKDAIRLSLIRKEVSDELSNRKAGLTRR